MKKKFIKSIFPTSKAILKIFNRRYTVFYTNEFSKPVAYIVHHQNLNGPFTALLWFKGIIHPWVLSVFCNQKTCFKQYYDYTFTRRFKISKPIALILAYPISFYISGLMKSMGSIPVYRNSMSIIKTFKESLIAMSNNESLLICPDIDYSDASENMGEMYNGFLDLERFYLKQTGEHLPFVPIYINKNNYCIYVGQAIYFEAEKDFKTEKGIAYDKIKQEFLRLEREKHNH